VKKTLPILILVLILLFSMACVLNRFNRGGTATTSSALPTYTPAKPSTSVATQVTVPPSATPTITPLSSAATATLQPLTGPATSTLASTFLGIGAAVDCDTLIEIKVLSAPTYYTYLNLLKANGNWLILHLQLINLTGETYNYLHENDFTLTSTSTGQSVVSMQPSDIEVYLVWAYASYLVDPLPGAGTSPRIVAFDVDPTIKDWTLIFAPKDSPYSTTPFCTVEIPLH
jgi:hypothetical protein